jgi:hypothetical protein
MERRARIEGLRPFLIHGEPYSEVYFSLSDDPETIQQTRLSADALPEGLRVGDEVLVLYLVNVVAGLRRAPEAG